MRLVETLPVAAPLEVTAGENLPPLRADFREQLAERVRAYDGFAPEAEHLRPHQVGAVQRFLGSVEAITRGDDPNVGMSLLHPTGSGKTVFAGEISRIVCSPKLTDSPPLRTLMLVPGYQILNQTTGGLEEVGAIRSFVPEISVGEYSGKSKDTSADLTVMNYQALGGAIARGDIDKIDPAIVICDETHHVIDGKWAEDVQEVRRGRLSLGLTSTPAYNAMRDVRRLFPNVLDHKTLREGIEEGILAELRGFLYQASAKLVVTKGRKDFSDAEIFAAVANSQDNYLAAAICAGEVAQGRRGIVSCAPGFDRAHAKIMAKILQYTPVNASQGRRNIKAAYVDGETHPDILRGVMDDYREGRLDVLTYVDLLLEGWDSPETEFGVMVRPTKSVVLEEQRIGRLVRPLPDKVATLHEIVYQIEGDNQLQKTHLDVLDDTGKKHVQGRRYGGGTPTPYLGPRKGRSQSAGHIFDVDKFAVDSGLIAAMTSADHEATQTTSLEAQKDAIPYSWSTAHMLASRFGISREETDDIISSLEVPARTIEVEGAKHTYYAPAATPLIAGHLGIEKMPDSDERPLTLSDLVEYVRDNSYATRMRSATIRRYMERAGVEPVRYLTDDNRIVWAYPYESRDVPFTSIGHQPYQQPETLNPAITEAAPRLEVVNWLASILVNPAEAPTARERQRITAGQSCLLLAVKERKAVDPEDAEALAMELTQLKVEPNPQMLGVMKTQELNFVDLVMLAMQAQKRFEGKASSSRAKAA